MTLRFAMEQQKVHLDPQLENSYWTTSVCNFIDVIIKFVPTVTHYEMDMITLWFMVLDLVQDEKWTFNKASEEKVR